MRLSGKLTVIAGPETSPMTHDESQNDGEGNANSSCREHGQTSLSRNPLPLHFHMDSVIFSKVLFSIRDETADYSCICDFKTFEKNKLDDHLCSNHKQELKVNYFELLKELPVLPTKNYQNINPILSVDEFFSDNIELPLPEHTLLESPCRDMICKPSIFYICTLHPHIENIHLSTIEHHFKYDFPLVHKMLLNTSPQNW
jgi:hypothetical protein